MALTPKARFPAMTERRIWRSDADEPSEWTPNELIPEAGVGLLIGASGSGKNFLALDLGRAVATGKPFFGASLHARGGVAFLLSSGKAQAFRVRIAALEEPRQTAIAWAHWNDLQAPMSFRAVPTNATFEQLAGELALLETSTFQAQGVRLRMVVIDSLAMGGLLPPDDDVAGAQALIAKLRAWAKRLGVFLLLVNYRPRAGMRQWDWPALAAMVCEADLVLDVRRRGRAATRELVATKGPWSAPRSLGTYRLTIVPVGVDEKGCAVTSCVVAHVDQISHQQ